MLRIKKLETRTHVVEIMDKLKNRLPYSYCMNQCVENLKSEVPSLAMKKLNALPRIFLMFKKINF